mmetsp:Transcript_8678/g.13180  ORF Transcript_8678/g.13180 Transcript_8678/m.13180 type:complete len:203 (+) Transcript_8678:835-1443(+)
MFSHRWHVLSFSPTTRMVKPPSLYHRVPSARLVRISTTRLLSNSCSSSSTRCGAKNCQKNIVHRCLRLTKFLVVSMLVSLSCLRAVAIWRILSALASRRLRIMTNLSAPHVVPSLAHICLLSKIVIVKTRSSIRQLQLRSRSILALCSDKRRLLSIAIRSPCLPTFISIFASAIAGQSLPPCFWLVLMQSDKKLTLSLLLVS